MKPHLFALRVGWFWFRRGLKETHNPLEHFHNRRFMDIKPAFEFSLQLCKPAGQIARIGERSPHFEKCPYDKDAHLDRTRAVQDVGCHDRTVFGESVRRVLAMPTSSFL